MSLARKRLLKYLLVGISSFLFDLLILYISVKYFQVPYYIATVYSFMIASSGNYLISRKLVFNQTQREFYHGFALFLMGASAGAILTASLVAAIVTYIGLYYIVARIIVAGLIGILNYLFNLYINFSVAGKH